MSMQSLPWEVRWIMTEPPDMPEGADDHTYRPKPGARIEPRGYAVGVRFHPEIKLDKKKGHLFAASLSDYLSFERNEFESHKWTFSEPLAGETASRFVITVGP